MVVSCEANRARWPRIFGAWLGKCGAPYAWAVGSEALREGAYAFCPDTRVLAIGCDDSYDGLTGKVAYGMRAVLELFPATSVLLKVDDDVVAHADAVRALLAEARGPDAYEGVVSTASGKTTFGIERYKRPENQTAVDIDPPVDYCGGPAYVLGRRAIEVVAADAAAGGAGALKFEDVNVGRVLARAGIAPTLRPVYTNTLFVFLRGGAAGWHDALRVAPSLFGEPGGDGSETCAFYTFLRDCLPSTRSH